MSEAIKTNLLLARIGERIKSRKIPVILQMNIVECGAACLTMVLAYHGKSIRLDKVRDAIGVDRDGANALAIIRAARGFKLRARGMRVDIEDLPNLEKGTILHWEMNHFVVFEKLEDHFMLIVDPAMGRRRVSIAQVRKSMTGVAIQLAPQDDFAPAVAGERPIVRHLKSALAEGGSWHRIAVLSLLLQLFALSIPILTGAIVDQVVPRADHHLLLIAGVGLGAVVVACFVAGLTRAHLLVQIRTHLDTRMTLGFLEHLVSLPLAFFQRRSGGDLMMRLNSNTTIREILTTGAVAALIDGSLVTGYLALLFIAEPSMGLLALGLGALQVLTFVFTRRRRQELFAEGLHSQSVAQSYQVELLGGIESLKSMGAENRGVEQYTRLFVDALNLTIERARLSATVDAVLNALRLGSPLVILLAGADHVLHGEMTLGTMLALNALAIGFLLPLATLVTFGEQFIMLGSYLGRLDDVFGAAPEQREESVLNAPPLTGQIRVENMSFRYGELSPMVVKNISVDIEPGQFVAIVGPSGSGKSTLASLLLALYRPTSGRIVYDGRDLATLEARSVRRQFGVVVQRPYIFSASLRSNISLGDSEILFEDVEDAARLAQIDGEIRAMPLGYESMLSEGGASISGGQRQRIALARALARKPAILLLDEATSALDSVTETKVEAAIRGLKTTRVVIAHRLSTVIKADLILMMHDGEIIERGTHAELLEKRGRYFELVTAQLNHSPAELRA